MIELAPSILSADFARLGEQVRAASQGGASIIHVDIMDGHFVPNLTIGPPVVKSLRKVTDLPLDCHLMIDEPDRWAPEYAEAGARNVGSGDLGVLGIILERDQAAVDGQSTR